MRLHLRIARQQLSNMFTLHVQVRLDPVPTLTVLASRMVFLCPCVVSPVHCGWAQAPSLDALPLPIGFGELDLPAPSTSGPAESCIRPTAATLCCLYKQPRGLFPIFSFFFGNVGVTCCASLLPLCLDMHMFSILLLKLLLETHPVGGECILYADESLAEFAFRS